MTKRSILKKNQPEVGEAGTNTGGVLDITVTDRLPATGISASSVQPSVKVYLGVSATDRVSTPGW